MIQTVHISYDNNVLTIDAGPGSVREYTAMADGEGVVFWCDGKLVSHEEHDHIIWMLDNFCNE